MTTAIVNLLNKPISMSRNQDERDIRQNAREVRQREGITLNPWLVSLIISVGVQLMGIAFFAGTIITRIEALDARIQRIERQLDAQERTRGPVNHLSPPVGGFGSPGNASIR